MSETANFTAVVLTRNEAENLPRCLASVAWCDEVLVLDSGSSDETVAVARALGARVLVRVPPPPFKIADQRNWALDQGEIRTKWVLFLDADEVVPTPLADRLKRIDARDDVDGYELTPRYLFWGRWLRRTQGYPNWHARVVRCGAVRFEGGVWEHFTPGARIERLPESYDHYANSKGFSDWLARHDRYSSWDAEKVTSYLANGDRGALGTERKARLRMLAARCWPMRPWARFVHMYFVRLGFLEGFPAFVFCMLYFFYEWMTVIKIIELRRRVRKEPL
jgi:glycosyltransferase involved in cell wall biosynthesis